MTDDTSGLTSRTPFARYSPEESCWKTSQDTLVWDSTPYSGTWSRSGMTRIGFAYELPMPELPTLESDFSLLPTPTVAHVRNHDEPIEAYQQRVRDYEEGRTRGKPGKSLGVAIRLLPTPVANDGRKAFSVQGSRDFQMTNIALMGFIEKPSSGGNASSDDLPQDSPTLWDA